MSRRHQGFPRDRGAKQRFVAPRVVALLASSATVVGACVYPATEVEVRVGTDVDPRVPLLVTVRVTAGANEDADQTGHAWHRIDTSVLDAGTADSRVTDGAPMDGALAHDAGPSDSNVRDERVTQAGIATPFPFHFFVIPSGHPHDSHVHLFLEARVGDIIVYRHAAFAFTPGTRSVLPLFISARCALPAASPCAGSTACTQSEYCEQQGQTCGNDGECRAIESMPSTDSDASFGDVGPGIAACGAYGEACCALGPGCDPSLACVGGRCQRCTDTAERCCTGADFLPDGTECAPSSDPCKRAGTCTAGVCGPMVDAPDGTPCGTSVNECHTGGTCASGMCQAGGARPDGTPWGSGGIHRCCGGNPVTLDSTSNCNACGLSCRAGACNYHASIGQYLCACTANTQCAPLICRSSTYPDGLTCIPSDGSGNCTGACPNGSICHSAHLASQPNYCYYP